MIPVQMYSHSKLKGYLSANAPDLDERVFGKGILGASIGNDLYRRRYIKSKEYESLPDDVLKILFRRYAVASKLYIYAFSCFAVTFIARSML